MVHFFSIYLIVLLINSYHARRRIIQHFPSSLGDERYPELSSRLFEGDILMPHGEDVKNAVISPRLKWPDGVILYEFTTNYTETEKEKVIRSMDLIESKTCIKFRKRQCDEEVYILINKMAGKGCFALIGHRPQYSPMLVNLQAPECLRYSGTIQHELLHVIGLFHEQARADRDEHVEILWDNVEEDHYFDFSKAPPGYTTTYNIPYNLYSVMHYPNIAFSKNGQPTIISKKDPKNTDMGQREGVTEGDLEKVRRMYHCKNTNPNESNSNSQISNIFNIFNIFKVN